MGLYVINKILLHGSIVQHMYVWFRGDETAAATDSSCVT